MPRYSRPLSARHRAILTGPRTPFAAAPHAVNRDQAAEIRRHAGAGANALAIAARLRLPYDAIQAQLERERA